MERMKKLLLKVVELLNLPETHINYNDIGVAYPYSWKHIVISMFFVGFSFITKNLVLGINDINYMFGILLILSSIVIGLSWWFKSDKYTFKQRIVSEVVGHVMIATTIVTMFAMDTTQHNLNFITYLVFICVVLGSLSRAIQLIVKIK